MAYHHASVTAHRRARSMRPDAVRCLRPDAAKFLKPGSDPADAYPALAQAREAIRHSEDLRFAAAIAQQRTVLDDLRRDTGIEAYARNNTSQVRVRETYSVRVVVVPDRFMPKGFRVDTACPLTRK